jgi:hypothetical protein
MAYPPTPPPNTRADNTPLPTNHAGDHNGISDALTDIINELGSDPKGASASVTARLDDLGLFTAWPADVARVQQSSNITLTGIQSGYQILNGMVHAYFYASCSTAGSAGTAVSLKPPVAAHAQYAGHGSISILDSGTAWYQGGAVFSDVNVVQCFADGRTAAVGADPNFALTTGDAIHAVLIYRPAA